MIKFCHIASILFLLFYGAVHIFPQPYPFTELPKDEKAVLDEMHCLITNGDYEKALQKSSFFEKNPNSVYGRQLRDFQKNKEIEKDHVQLAMNLYWQGKFKESLEIITDFLKENSGNYYAILVKAMNLVMLNPRKAIDECSKILYYYPFNASLITVRGDAYYILGEKQQAEKDYSFSLFVKPSDSVYNRRGRIYFESDRIEDSLKDFDESIRLNPNGLNESYLDRAVIYQKLGEFEKSESDCETYINAGGQDASVFRTLAAIHYEKKDFQKALDYINRFVDASPNNADGYYSRACVYFYMGEYSRTLSDCEKALEFSTSERERVEIQALIQKVKGL